MQVTCSCCSTKNNFQTFFSSSVNDRSGFSFLPPFFGPFCLFCWGFLEPPGRWALNFCEPWAIFANRKYTELFFSSSSLQIVVFILPSFLSTSPPTGSLRHNLTQYRQKQLSFHCGFIIFFTVLMWKRNLVIHDCTLQHYIHIRIYKKKIQFWTISTCYKINPDQVIINNNNNILSLKEAIWTTLLPWWLQAILIIDNDTQAPALIGQINVENTL